MAVLLELRTDVVVTLDERVTKLLVTVAVCVTDEVEEEVGVPSGEELMPLAQ